MNFSYVIFGVHVKESKMLDAAAVGVLADGSDVSDPDSSSVVRLEHDAVSDVQVMINGDMICGFEGSGPLGFGQVGKVDDVGDWDAVFDHALHLVELIVQQHELVPVALGPPALVSVRRAGVLETTEHFRVGLVGRVPNRDPVF